MNQIEKHLSQAIDAVYAALAVAEDEQVKIHLGYALDSLVSALHGEYEKDEG